MTDSALNHSSSLLLAGCRLLRSFGRSARRFGASWSALPLLPLLAMVGCSGNVADGAHDGELLGDDQDLIDDDQDQENGKKDQDDDLVIDDEKDGEPDKDCEKSLRLEAVSVSAPAPFDVVIVADHSESLSWSRDDLAAGLQNFLSEVRGYEVRFFVLTPTQYGASSEASLSPVNGQSPVSWQDPGTLEPYAGAMTSYEQSCFDAAGQPMTCPVFPEEITEDFSLSGTWSLEMPPAVAAISPEMDDAAALVESQAIADAILNLGLGGSSDEQPVCTLHRYLEQDPQSLPENVVFLLLTDEDDNSDPTRCLAAQHVDVTAHGQKEVFEILGSGHRAQRKFMCTPVGDQGQPVGEPVAKLWNLGACSASRACTAQEEQDSEDECPVNHVMSDCTISCTEQTYLACRVDASAEVSDACSSPFSLGGVSYMDLLDYCEATHPGVESWGGCTSYEKDSVAVQEVELSPLTDDQSVAGMAAHFRERATQVFGTEGFSIELIAFSPDFSCTPQTGQSHADSLLSLIDSEEHLFPICGDYAGALSEVTSFARELLQTRYTLALEEGEEPDAVRVFSNDGTARQLAPADFSYQPTSGTLEIDPDALLASDSGIEVDVQEACVVK